MRYKKVLITGANGTLGTELQEQLEKHGIPYIGTNGETDVRDASAVVRAVTSSECDVVIHCAAITDTARCEIEKELAYDVNVRGTQMVARICKHFDRFMVHISTDYVYRGDKSYTGDGTEGNYDTGDILDPINFYSYTKVLADISVQNMLPYSSLITRQSFKQKGPWPYPKAFVDQYTSRDTVDVIADQILRALFMGHSGIIHLGTERKTVYDLAKQQSPDVEPISVEDIKDVVIPKDTSLKLTRLEEVEWKNL